MKHPVSEITRRKASEKLKPFRKMFVGSRQSGKDYYGFSLIRKLAETADFKMLMVDNKLKLESLEDNPIKDIGNFYYERQKVQFPDNSYLRIIREVDFHKEFIKGYDFCWFNDLETFKDPSIAIQNVNTLITFTVPCERDKNYKFLKSLFDGEGWEVIRSSVYDNASNLSAGWIKSVEAKFNGERYFTQVLGLWKDEVELGNL